MEKQELIEKLNKIYEIQKNPELRKTITDQEDDHYQADGLLLSFIDDEEISEAYLKISKWYA